MQQSHMAEGLGLSHTCSLVDSSVSVSSCGSRLVGSVASFVVSWLQEASPFLIIRGGGMDRMRGQVRLRDREERKWGSCDWHVK